MKHRLSLLLSYRLYSRSRRSLRPYRDSSRAEDSINGCHWNQLMKIYEGERRREKRDTGEIKRKTEVRREKRKAEEIKEIQMSEEKVERTTVVMREENKRKE
jgi:hypothetical protein